MVEAVAIKWLPSCAHATERSTSPWNGGVRLVFCVKRPSAETLQTAIWFSAALRTLAMLTTSKPLCEDATDTKHEEAPQITWDAFPR